ncbi:muramidase [Flammeovirga pectinis]|uniref:Muramidase n=1 Tax=Flammeovirga pectinis TaxID=2494373 RepID=A0A3S9P7Q4_9BACT|nr:glucosaminidase domain-containing protein [Flammeovirga pectinis]AZQ64226.1 muramidase [Flammeovirga pectinis]
MYFLKNSSELSVTGTNLSIGVKFPSSVYMRYKGNIYSFIINPKLAVTIIVLLLFVLMTQFFSDSSEKIIYVQAPIAVNYNGQEPTLDEFIEDFGIEIENPNVIQTAVVPVKPVNHLSSYREEKLNNVSSYIDRFQIERQLIVTEFLINNKITRVDQLEDDQLLLLNQKIGGLFQEFILDQMNAPPHVYSFFTSSVPLRKIETALMEQARYHVPASITLAQAALETGYGKRVIGNNYFGVKDKSKRTVPITTTEYYTKEEYKRNKGIVVSAKKVKKGNRVLYKCTVRDSFAEYKSPWESFRAHSLFLNKQKRYAPLFTQGRDYIAWANMIGSTKYGGVGYATSPLYGELLRKIIKRYHLDLLDY